MSREIAEKIKRALIEAGYEDRMKHGPFKGPGHCEGLPGGQWVPLDPHDVPSNEFQSILVTPTAVELWAVRMPSMHNDWFRRKSLTYSAPEEMLSHVEKLIHQPTGCW
mgnify:CR=1 FL=1